LTRPFEEAAHLRCRGEHFRGVLGAPAAFRVCTKKIFVQKNFKYAHRTHSGMLKGSMTIRVSLSNGRQEIL